MRRRMHSPSDRRTKSLFCCSFLLIILIVPPPIKKKYCIALFAKTLISVPVVSAVSDVRNGDVILIFVFSRSLSRVIVVPQHRISVRFYAFHVSRQGSHNPLAYGYPNTVVVPRSHILLPFRHRYQRRTKSKHYLNSLLSPINNNVFLIITTR